MAAIEILECRGGATVTDYRLIHGDCLDVLPTLEAGSVDAVITDPPYGIKIIQGGGRGMNGWRDYGAGGWDTVRPARECFTEILRVGKSAVIWGGNYFTDYLYPSSQWLVWDKGQRDFSLADCELAWCSSPKAARVLTYPRAAALQENGLHPTQKPLAVMRWCVRMATRPGDLVLDPFMGSGTTGVACRMEGRRFIGIELDANYYRIAEERIANAQPPLLLDTPTNLHADPTQAALLDA